MWKVLGTILNKEGMAKDKDFNTENTFGICNRKRLGQLDEWKREGKKNWNQPYEAHF